MSTTTTNFGWTIPSDTDLVKDGASAMRTLGNGIDSSMADLKGGTTGQVLSKASGTDMDFTWVAQDDSNAIQNAIVDAKGDLIVGASADTPARLAVGTNGYILTANSSATNGVEWAAPAGGGKILQVVESRNTTQRSTTTGWPSFATSGWTASITPSSSTSKILIIASIPFSTVKNANDAGGGVRLTRSSTVVFPSTALYSHYVSASGTGTLTTTVGLTCLDAPATTSAITYNVEFQQSSGSTTAYISFNSQEGSIILMEVAA